MTGIVLSAFNGIAPKVNERFLAEDVATVAENCRLDHSTLEPIKNVVAKTTVPWGTKTLFYYSATNQWLSWPSSVGVVDTLMPQDAYNRMFISDTDYPKIRSNYGVYRMGIPAPDAPTILILQSGIDPEDDSNAALLAIEQRSYVYTWVDAFGAEGPPSEPSSPVEVGADSTVMVYMGLQPTGNYNWGSKAKRRIYRANTGTTTTEYQFLVELDLNVIAHEDTLPNAGLQEVLVSETWVGPPDDDVALYPNGPIKGFTEMPGGIIAGFSGNQVCLCEPYLPHAWPIENRRSTGAEIVGIVAVQQGLLICTKKNPYLLLGTVPSTMAVVPIEAANHPCLSADSIVDMGAFAIYASHDGLIQVQGNSATVVTEGLITRDQWRADFSPANLRAFAYEGAYLGFYGDEFDEGTGFIFDPRQGKATLTTLAGHNIQGAYYDSEQDELNVIAYMNGAGDTGPPGASRAIWADGVVDSDFTWTSKLFYVPTPTAMSIGRVQSDTFPIHVTIEADDAEYYSALILEDRPFRLPAGRAARNWKITLSGQGSVKLFGIWDSAEEVV